MDQRRAHAGSVSASRRRGGLRGRGSSDLCGSWSGKTRTLVESIAALVERRIAEPGQIAAISFTRKAADELKSRLGRLGARANGLTAGTFHSRAVTLESASGA